VHAQWEHEEAEEQAQPVHDNRHPICNIIDEFFATGSCNLNWRNWGGTKKK